MTSNPTRGRRTRAVLLAVAALFAGTAQAATITWGAPQNITGDSNVSTTGTLARAANFTRSGGSFDANVTVGGVTFVRSPYVGQTTTLPNGDTMVASDSSAIGAYAGFGGATAPFSSLSTNLKSLLSTGFFNDGVTSTAATTARSTLTLRNLTVGTSYQVQVFVNDYRLNNLGQNNPGLVTVVGTATLQHNVNNALGGIGQYVLGSFTADATTQAITFTGGNTGTDNTAPSSTAIVNAYQLRITAGGSSSSASSSSSVSSVSSSSASSSSSAQPPIVGQASSPTGWAAAAGGTTGGAGGTVVNVSTGSAFLANIGGSDKKIINITAPITLGAGMHQVGSNKTINGVGTNGKISGGGGLEMNGSSNVIIRNLTISGATVDAINIQNGAHHIWVDHCDLSSSVDGLLDFKRGSDYATFSYNHFHDHDKVALIGHDDTNGAQDTGKLRVTYIGNLFNGTGQRHPRVRFSQAHVLNNYYVGTNQYGIGVGYKANIYAEGNYFENVKNTYKHMDSQIAPTPNGYIVSAGNLYSGSTKVADEPPPSSAAWLPSSKYSYTAKSGDWVKANGRNYVGPGKPTPP